MGHNKGKCGTGAPESVYELFSILDVPRPNRIPPEQGSHDNDESAGVELAFDFLKGKALEHGLLKIGPDVEHAVHEPECLRRVSSRYEARLGLCYDLFPAFPADQRTQFTEIKWEFVVGNGIAG